MSLTNNVMCMIMLGSKYSGEEGGRKINELLARIVELMGMNHVGDSIPWGPSPLFEGPRPMP